MDHTEARCTTVADLYLTMTPGDFSDWLARRAMDNPEYEIFRTAYLAGRLTEEWAKDHASADVLCND